LSPVGQLKPSNQLQAVWKVVLNIAAQFSRVPQRRAISSAHQIFVAWLDTSMMGRVCTRRLARSDRPLPCGSIPLGWDF